MRLHARSSSALASCAALVMLAIMLFSARAHAADATSDELRKRGNELMLAGRAREAIPLYEEGFAKSHDPAFLYNLGRAFESLGQYADALERLEAFDRNVTAEQRAALPDLPKFTQYVREHVSSLAIVVDVDGAVVKLDGKVVGESPMPKEVRRNVGAIRLEVAKDGFQPYVETVNATTGRVRVDVKLVPRPASFTVPGPSDKVPPRDDGSVAKKWWFWTAIGVVVVGGTVTTVLLLREPDHRMGSIPPGDVATSFRF